MKHLKGFIAVKIETRNTYGPSAGGLFVVGLGLIGLNLLPRWLPSGKCYMLSPFDDIWL